MRKWIVVCAIAPLFAILAPVEFACFSWALAIFHLAFGFSVSVLLMEIMFLGSHKVPFTCSYLMGKVNLIGLGVLYIFGFTTYSGVMSRLEQWLGAKSIAAASFVAAAAVAWLLLARRLTSPLPLDFTDAGDPDVRTLELTAPYENSHA